jgi:DNA-binding CsgD family transcriptional regulator
VQDAIAHAFWSSVVDFVEGKVDEALAGLDAIEDAAIGERLVGSFVARGPHAARLLAAVTHLRPESHFGSLRQEDALSVPVADAAPHLTRRERAVLAYLAQRLTYGEIAGRLFISQNTVKSHATSIYMKLGAKGRREAVERAASLGLL